MGFRFWYEGILFISYFALIIGLPCFMVSLLGTKMINDLGNFPTKSAKIQTVTLLQLFVVEIIASTMLFIFYRVFS